MAVRSWPRLLFVEGPEDVHFFAHLATRHGLPLYDEKRREGPADGLVLRPFDGVGNLRRILRTTLSDLSIDSVGVVVDADAGPGRTQADRWASVRDFLSSPDLPVSTGTDDALSYILPAQPEHAGTIASATWLPRIGIWLMPDNRTPGMLEHFVEFLVPQGDPLWSHAVDAVRSIPEADRPFAEVHAKKAEIHTWLAWRQEPGMPIGLSITKRFLDTDVPQAQLLLRWMLRLFWPERIDEAADAATE